MAASPRLTSRLRGFVAIVAWPLGPVLWVAVTLMMPAREPSGPCTTTTTVTGSTDVTSIACPFDHASGAWWRWIIALTLTLGPGVVATRAWWRARSAAL